MENQSSNSPLPLGGVMVSNNFMRNYETRMNELILLRAALASIALFYPAVRLQYQSLLEPDNSIKQQ